MIELEVWDTMTTLMNPAIRTRLSELTIVVLLIAAEVHMRLWGADPSTSSREAARKSAGAIGLQSIERVPMTEIFFLAAKEGGSGSKSGENRDAIVGEGFFQIQMLDGLPAYTRNGNFKVASDGRVVTRDGFQLLGGIPSFPPDATGVIVTAPGLVFIATASGSFAAGRINLVRFANPAALKTIGSDIFQESETSGPPETGNPGENGFGEIGPGFFRLAGSFGFTTQLTKARIWIDVEVSQDAKTWTVLASGVSANGEKLFVRDLRAADFAHRFYRVRWRPFPVPLANGQ